MCKPSIALGKHRVDGLGEAFEPADHRDRNVGGAAIFQLVDNLSQNLAPHSAQPTLRALPCFIAGDGLRQVHGLVADQTWS
jgi:hypothetical protein